MFLHLQQEGHVENSSTVQEASQSTALALPVTAQTETQARHNHKFKLGFIESIRKGRAGVASRGQAGSGSDKQATRSQGLKAGRLAGDQAERAGREQEGRVQEIRPGLIAGKSGIIPRQSGTEPAPGPGLNSPA